MVQSNIENIKKCSVPIKVLMPNGTIIESLHTGIYPGIPELPESARKVHILPHLSSGSLLSVPQLCDHNCNVIFKKMKRW